MSFDLELGNTAFASETLYVTLLLETHSFAPVVYGYVPTYVRTCFRFLRESF